jgi:hypothetical protein
MSTELEDLERRVEQLEGHMHQLELRLNYDDMRHQILSAIRTPVGADAGQPGETPGDVSGHQEGEPGQDHNLGRLEAMVRSVLFNQGQHTSDLRRARSYLEILVRGKLL